MLAYETDPPLHEIAPDESQGQTASQAEVKLGIMALLKASYNAIHLILWRSTLDEIVNPAIAPLLSDGKLNSPCLLPQELVLQKQE
jgi:hypothetical protein